MRETCAALSVALFALSAFTKLQAQTVNISVPVWIETNDSPTAPKFEAALNGKPVPVTEELGPTSDQVILVVLDLTGDLSLIDAAKQAVIDQISKLPRNAWVGLLRAQDGLHVLADPGPDRQQVIDAIRSLSNSGEPGLLETVQSALSLADALIRKSPVRVSVLYVTDGSIYGYREDYTNPVINQSDPHDLSRMFPEALIQEKASKLVEEISSLQAPLFVVDLNYRPDRLNRAYQNSLGNLADSTGGRSVICRSVAEIPQAISDMFARISSAWMLTLAVPTKIHSNLQIHLKVGSPDGDLRLSWRAHLHAKGG
jgi:VWA domain-containing protein